MSKIPQNAFSEIIVRIRAAVRKMELNTTMNLARKWYEEGHIMYGEYQEILTFAEDRAKGLSV